MVRLEAKHLSKEFPGGVRAVDDVSFVIPPGSLFTLLGPSGCGKTTTLRLVAGLETPSAGKVFFDDDDYTDFPPSRRGIGMVFQSYALFPHMSIYENVAYGLRIRKARGAQIEKSVNEALDLVGLTGVSNRKPAQLSGGQQQRIALARAIVYDPKLLLLDEPLSNLDAKLRVYMRSEIRNIQQRSGLTTVYVTHDQEEALSISDWIAVMDSGEICQLDQPHLIYERPASVFVASFIGQANFLDVEIRSLSADGAHVTAKDGTVLRTERIEGDASEFEVGKQALLFFRPELVSLGTEPRENDTIACKVRDILFLGETTKYELELSHGQKVTVSVNRLLGNIVKGQQVYLTVLPEDSTLFSYKQKEKIADGGK